MKRQCLSQESFVFKPLHLRPKTSLPQVPTPWRCCSIMHQLRPAALAGWPTASTWPVYGTAAPSTADAWPVSGLLSTRPSAGPVCVYLTAAVCQSDAPGQHLTAGSAERQQSALPETTARLRAAGVRRVQSPRESASSSRTESAESHGPRESAESVESSRTG